MKKIVLVVCLMSASLLIFAQGAGYEKGMKKGMELMENSKNSADFIVASNHFERIASVEKNQWLPFYWAAYTSLIAGIQEEKNSVKDDLFEKADDFIDKADAINGSDKSEVLTVKSYIMLMGISVNPMIRGPLNGPKGARLIQEAQELNPANPRPFFVQGQNTFYTPEFYGGGKEKALPLLEKAKSKYDAEKKSDDFKPNWGRGRCLMLLEECKK